MNNVRVRLPRKLSKSVSGGILAEEGRLNPVGALNITLNLQPLNRVSMTLAENDLPLAMHDLVEVYNKNGSVGVYRVTKITNTYKKQRKIELSHGLDVFSDATLSRIEDKWHGSVAQYLQMIIDGQTQKIGGQFYWQLGRCDDTSYWEKDLKYDNLMSLLTDLAKTEEDYMFTFDQSTFPWTLNFVSRDSTVLSEFRLNRNTSECSVVMDDSDLCTRLYLSVSSENEDDEGHGTYFEEGYYTFNDTAAQATWGIVCKTAGIDQSVFSPTVDLEAWKDAYFARHNAPNIQITIDGVELNKLTGESFDEVHLGRICRTALPEYNSTFNERVISVNYPDALRIPESVKISLANKRQTAEGAFQEISDTASSAASAARSGGRGAHNDATYFRRTIGDTANGLYSRIEQTAYYIRSEVVDTANGLYSKIEQTASYIRSEVASTANGLNSKIEQTASYIRSEVSNTANGLNSKIEQTASYIRSEVSQTANGLSSRIDQNASQIALRVVKGDVATQLAVEAGNVSIEGGNLVVDGYVTAAGLDAAIANLSVVHVKSIQAAANSTGANLSLPSVTAQSKLYVGTAEGSVELIGAGIRDAVTDLNLAHTSGTATYTLQKKTISSHTSWTDVGTFSKAATLSVEYGGDNTGDTATFTVTGTPEENFPSGNSATGTFTVHQSKAAAYITDANGTIRARIDNPQYANGWAAAYAEVSLPTTSSTASSFSVKTPKSSVDGGADTETYTVSSATNDIVVVKNIAGTVVARLEHGKYTAGVLAGEAEFDLVDITLQGTSESVYVPDSEHGTVYYQAGTMVTRYKGDGTRLGSSGTYYKGNGTRLTTATRYKSGNKLASGTYYLGDGSSVTGRGTKVSVTAIGNAVHFKRHTSGKPTGTYYTIVSSGYDLTYYLSKAAADYYQGNGSSVTGRGTSVTAYIENNAGSYYLRGGSETVYVADSSGSYYLRGDSVTAYPTDSSGSNYLRGTAEVITPIGTSSIKVTQNTRYKSGTRYNKNKYYEKTA